MRDDTGETRTTLRIDGNPATDGRVEVDLREMPWPEAFDLGRRVQTALDEIVGPGRLAAYGMIGGTR